VESGSRLSDLAGEIWDSPSLTPSAVLLWWREWALEKECSWGISDNKPGLSGYSLAQSSGAGRLLFPSPGGALVDGASAGFGGLCSLENKLAYGCAGSFWPAFCPLSFNHQGGGDWEWRDAVQRRAARWSWEVGGAGGSAPS